MFHQGIQSACKKCKDSRKLISRTDTCDLRVVRFHGPSRLQDVVNVLFLLVQNLRHEYVTVCISMRIVQCSLFLPLDRTANKPLPFGYHALADEMRHSRRHRCTIESILLPLSHLSISFLPTPIAQRCLKPAPEIPEFTKTLHAQGELVLRQRKPRFESN